MLPTLSAILNIAGPALLGLLLLGICLNFIVDPASIYWRRSKQPRNLRLRKMELLQQMGQRRGGNSIGTLILGSSRVFNLMLSGKDGFPQPVFNFAVTSAKAEDYLACWNYALSTQPAPPKLLVICVELAAFHPAMGVEWEAATALAYRRLLLDCGVVRPGNLWRLGLLFSHVQLRHALTAIQRRLRGKDKFAAKFRWNPDGSATWHDLLLGQRNPNLLIRQLRTYPRNGIGLRQFTRLGAMRQRCFEQLLDSARQHGTQVVTYLAPEHPDLISRLGPEGAAVHNMVSAWLSQACTAGGASFLDLWDSRQLELQPLDYRDALHLIDEAQLKVESAIARQTSGPLSSQSAIHA